MHDYSPVDGFVDISQALANMIKSLANEPSLGLFYLQQHTHKALPNLVNLRNNILSKSRQITLHTQDSEDSITMLTSIKDCGFPIVDDMIKDITKSLAIISTKQPKKGFISSSKSANQTWKSISDVEKSTNYLSSVFKSAKQKATNLKWAAQEEATNDTMQITGEGLTMSGGNKEKDMLVDDLISSENFDEFKADKEARFEEWLSGSNDTHSDQ